MMAYLDYIYTGSISLFKEFEHSLLNQTQISCVGELGLVDFSNCPRNYGSLGAGNEAVLKDLVDWPKTTRDGYILTDINTVVNSYAFEAVSSLSRLATATGKTKLGGRLE